MTDHVVIVGGGVAAMRCGLELRERGLRRADEHAFRAEVYVPFGGIKASGWGPHKQGRAAIEFHTDVATVYLDA